MDTIKIKRKIESTHLEIAELEKWVGKKVDIIIREEGSDSSPSVGSAAGLLAEFSNQDLIKDEKTGWEKAVEGKYGNR
jgi:hypothetical protein